MTEEQKIIQDLLKCLEHLGVTEEILETTDFESAITEESISNLLLQTILKAKEYL